MKINSSSLICLCFLFYVASCYSQEEKKLSLGEQPIFYVSKANSMIKVDGKMEESDWDKTEARELEYFYKVEKADDEQETSFRMLWDAEYLYVFFEAKDKYLTAREKKRDGQPYFDDCLEIFLIPAPDSLDTHFGFELNLYKASNDFVYFNNYYKEKNEVLFSYNPDFEAEVSYRGTINNNEDIDEGWNLEMAIPISALGSLPSLNPVKKDSQWAFLAVRQDRNDAKGNRRSTSTIFPIYDISKNVHQVNRFGLLEFKE